MTVRRFNKRLRAKILQHLREEWRFDEGGSSWDSFDALAKELREFPRSVKTEVRRMERDGILRFSCLIDVDGRIRGSGYLLTPRYDQVIPRDFFAEEPDDFRSVHEGEYEARFCIDCADELLPDDKKRCRACEAALRLRVARDYIEDVTKSAGHNRKRRQLLGNARDSINAALRTFPEAR